MAALFVSQPPVLQSHASDTVPTADGRSLTITFFGHGSIGFEYSGVHVYVDPVSDYADFSLLPPASAVVVTHEHGDHLDPRAIDALTASASPAPLILGNATAIEALGRGTVLTHGEQTELSPAPITVSAVAAYNTSPEKQNFHPLSRAHNGYVFSFGGTRVYVAGDTEPIPEMSALGAIDIAFLPVNLPYTMTEAQAAAAVRAVRPRIFYPYHYGGTDHPTDLGLLSSLLTDTGIEIRIRPLE